MKHLFSNSFNEFVPNVWMRMAAQRSCDQVVEGSVSLFFLYYLLLHAASDSPKFDVLYLYPSGIRNFLTLFLSIEVSKAMQEVSDAQQAGDSARQVYAQTMVDYFTQQLSESNPILTEISDAMTDEGHYLEKMASCLASNDPEGAALWKTKSEEAAGRKRLGNDKLMACSARYNSLMKSIREERKAVLSDSSS